MTPEQKARERIEAMLALCGWEVQDYNASANRAIALRGRFPQMSEVLVA